MRYPTFPLERVKVTQPFGVNWVGPGYYDNNPSGLHGGLDLRARVGMPLRAPVDCKVVMCAWMGRAGYTIVMDRQDKERDQWDGLLYGERIMFMHCSEFRASIGDKVRAGDIVALSGNSSTGYVAPHLHYIVRPVYWKRYGTGPFPVHESNGYHGNVDPVQYHDPRLFMLPVDYGYDVEPVPLKVFAPHFLWILRQPGLWTKIGLRGYRGLRYGRWDLRIILDPAMFDTWTRMTKMEYEQTS
jgi:murein DD-endopeptidase MepM/ murein hydrolase activator NlpD